MGQYYILSCPETGSYFSARELGSYIKAWEQVWSTSMPAAFAFACSAGRGSHARDLPWAPQGPWAGRMPLMIGDYAEEDDLIGRDDRLAMPEDGLYANSSSSPLRLDAKAFKRKQLKDLSVAFTPILERVMNMRIKDADINGDVISLKENAWRSVYLLPVVSTDTGWDIDYADQDEKARADSEGYYSRIGALENLAWKRDPLNITDDKHFTPLGEVPSTIPGKEMGIGGRMLWVNLDRQEFIDPEKMGDTPDLVGVMEGLSSRVALASTVHYQRRGGGDLDNLGPMVIAGRWRGDRIVLLGEEGFKAPKSSLITQATVSQHFTDISDMALAFINAEEYFGVERFVDEGEARTEPNALERKIIAAVLQSPELRKLGDHLTGGNLKVEITPPQVLHNAVGGKQELPRILTLPATVDAYLGGGKIFLSEETRRKIADLAAEMPAQELNLRAEDGRNRPTVYASADITLSWSPQSNHAIIALIGQIERAEAA